MRLSFLLTLVAALVLMGCSSNPVTTSDLAAPESSQIGLMGAYELTIDKANLTADMVAKRDVAAIGDSNLVSGLSFFTASIFCGDCFTLTDIGFDVASGNVVLTYQLRHPFAMGSSSLPPTAMNRMDLNVFDTALVIVPTGTATATTFTAGTLYAGYVGNAYGYTKELMNIAGVADEAMPFVLVVDDSLADPIASTYNKFAQGATASFDVEFSLLPGGDKLTFDLYLTLGYGAAAAGKDKPSFLAPKYFNPEYNRKAAWKVMVDVAEDWVEGDAVTEHPIVVSVYDWQVGATVSADWATEASLTAVRAASEVASVGLEIGLGTVTALTVADVTDPVSTGMPDNPLEYTFMVANGGQVAGTYMGLAIVTDTRVPPTTVGAFDGIIHTADGGGVLTPYATPAYITYQVFEYEVVVP
jgi:hypothetical protein